MCNHLDVQIFTYPALSLLTALDALTPSVRCGPRPPGLLDAWSFTRSTLPTCSERAVEPARRCPRTQNVLYHLLMEWQLCLSTLV